MTEQTTRDSRELPRDFLARELNDLGYLRNILDGSRSIGSGSLRDVRDAVDTFDSYEHCLTHRISHDCEVTADDKLTKTFIALRNWLRAYDEGHNGLQYYKILTAQASVIRKQNVNKMPIPSGWWGGNPTFSNETIGENIYKALVEIVYRRASSSYRYDAWKVDVFLCKRNQTGDIDRGALAPAYDEAKKLGICGICQEALVRHANGEDLIRLRCGVNTNADKLRTRHVYHRGCIEEWGRNHDRCPECRDNFKSLVTV